MDSGKQAWPEHKENGAGSVRDQVRETASVLGSRRDPSHGRGAHLATLALYRAGGSALPALHRSHRGP